MPELIQPKDINTIIIFRTDRIGEVLLSTVCISALKKYFTQSCITFVTSSYSKDIVSKRGDVDEIFIFDTITKGNSFLKLIKLIAYLKKRKYDLAVILNPHKLLHCACLLAGIKYRVGYNRKWGFCLTHRIEDKKYECKKHEIEYNLDLLKVIGVGAQNITAPYIVFSKETADFVDKLIEQSGLSNGKPIISIHPESSNPAKRWPSKNFTGLIEKIKENFDCNIALVGGSEDKLSVMRITGSLRQHVIDLSGALTIKQLSAFIKKCALFIGNDAGPMHIAASVKVPVIALFGNASNPVRWRPWGEGHIVLHKNDINAITVGEIIEAIGRIL